DVEDRGIGAHRLYRARGGIDRVDRPGEPREEQVVEELAGDRGALARGADHGDGAGAKEGVEGMVHGLTSGRAPPQAGCAPRRPPRCAAWPRPRPDSPRWNRCHGGRATPHTRCTPTEPARKWKP